MGYGPTSKMLVNPVDGCVQAKNVVPGSEMWTLDGDRTVRTAVVDVTAVKARTAVDVVTDHMTFTASPDLLLCTPDGWVPATDAAGKTVAWTPARKLCRERLTIKPGYEFGYFVGATCADGTVHKNYVSLIVNDQGFASRYAAALTACTGLSARLEPVGRPSGYLKRDVAGFRVRVVSSYLSVLVRQYVGGDAHHMRQRFPRVVLRDTEMFAGFMDGYVDGDGCRVTWGNYEGRVSRLYIADRWSSRDTYQPEEHRLQLQESSWIKVHEVRSRPALGTKPFTFYDYRLAPYPTFLLNGHLVREAR
ncbi:hypothetical protein ACFY40_31810 [Streptomyces sp. NPDC012950]|uniref:hypothetical protein n=1 Tax=Streptomyces sp. NPDC012950 TaxID=3364858 RepID=UPI0036BE9764